MLFLRDIEQTVSTLWLNKEARTWLLSNRKAPPPQCLRTADPQILEAVDRKGVVLYSQLMNFGHQDVMASIYPYCCKLLGKRWSGLVDDYLLRFPPDHFNFNRLCSKLPQYLSKHGTELLQKYPFLVELSDYEWIELEKMEDDRDIKLYPHQELVELEDLLRLAPVLNPTLSLRRYQFDVLAIAERLEKSGKPGKVKVNPVAIAVYRHPQDHLCKFVDLGVAAAHVVEQAADGCSYADLLKGCLPLVGCADPQAATVSVLELFEELQELQIFVGSKNLAGGNS